MYRLYIILWNLYIELFRYFFFTIIFRLSSLFSGKSLMTNHIALSFINVALEHLQSMLRISHSSQQCLPLFSTISFFQYSTVTSVAISSILLVNFVHRSLIVLTSNTSWINFFKNSLSTLAAIDYLLCAYQYFFTTLAIMIIHA